jgi:hypothetical protein
MSDFGYKPNMNYREFLEARLKHMKAEQALHELGTGDWAYWKGRALSYQDMLGALDGAELITSTPGKKLAVEAAT